ncbi:MAG: hypothetical protein K2L20_06580, partial [Ligilactobacillus sp.]|nr:hypothetical protein [Ligilactobacillus sp.]
MKTRGELKAEARELLAGNWGKAILLNIIPILGTVFIGLILTLLGAVIVFLFSNCAFSGNGSTVNETVNSST